MKFLFFTILPVGCRLHEKQYQLGHMELNRHPMGHNRIEYEQRSDGKKKKFIIVSIKF